MRDDTPGSVVYVSAFERVLTIFPGKLTCTRIGCGMGGEMYWRSNRRNEQEAVS